MRDVAVIGVGMIKFGRYPEKTVPELAAQAALLALKDAGIDMKEVELMASGNLYQSNAMVGQRILQGERNRLFDQDMLARVHGVNGDLGMEATGDANRNGINICALQDGMIIGIGCRAIFGGKVVGAVGFDVGDRH